MELTNLSPLALKVKTIIDGTYLAYKRGRRFRIKEHEITDIINAITELEKKHGDTRYTLSQSSETPPPAPLPTPATNVMLKKGDPGYEEWLASLPKSTTYKKKD